MPLSEKQGVGSSILPLATMKKIIKMLIFTILDSFYDVIFGKVREDKHIIWRPKNYLHYSKYYWKLVQKPLESRGIYQPLLPSNIKTLKDFWTFHDEHLVLDEFSELIESESKDTEKWFIDIGAGDGVDASNTFNLVQNKYKGHMLEVDDSKFAKLATIYQDFPDVQLYKTKITPNNVVDLLSSFNLPNKVDVLNLDIDSYDFEVLEKILPKFKFKFLILEINPLFPKSIDFSVTYDEAFEWESNQFQGASLSMFYKLLKKHNYSCVHINGAFLLALDSDSLNSKVLEKNISELEETLKSSLKNNDPKDWDNIYKLFWSSSDEEIISHSNELFKNYNNYIIKKSNL